MAEKYSYQGQSQHHSIRATGCRCNKSMMYCYHTYLNFETVDKDVTLEETSTTFQPSSSSTISSKRTRSPESCEHLRSKFRRCGENWERIVRVRDVSISPPPPVSPATPVKISLPSFPSNDVRFYFKMLAACLLSIY